jgi:SagB-type dehydrogenase family enzyme
MPSLTNVQVRTLADFWNDARLRADDAKSTSVRPAPGVVPWRAALEDVLSVGYGVQTQCRFVDGAWEQVRWRTTPSAGALYPFEVIACVVGEGSYLWDVDAGRLVACGLPRTTQQDLMGAGLMTGRDQRLEAVIVVIARPWVGMKKYRQRGYAYCHLDVGHVTTNLAMYAAALGYAPTLHLRFSRAYLADHLKLHGLCREPVAVLSFASAASARTREPNVDVEIADRPARATIEWPDSPEMQNWESLKPILSFASSIEGPCPPACAPFVSDPGPRDHLVPLPDGMPPLATPLEWRSAILARRSAKGFRDRPLTLGQIGPLLSALRAEGVRADCSLSDSSRLGVRLVARNVDGLAGVFAYAPGPHALYQIDTAVDDIHQACMKQRTAVDVAALLIVHAPVDRLLEGYSLFAELHFHAGQLGQRLHLAAARLRGVGITCIGGFDGERCAALARLGAGEEVVYVVLLGIPDESGIKHDQLRVAYSHGYTTEEG